MIADQAAINLASDDSVIGRSDQMSGSGQNAKHPHH